jgi:site-specific recombinase XerD
MASARKPGQTAFAFTYYGLHSRLRTAADKAELGARAIHGARHHAATTLLRTTGNLKLTQRMLGHASIQSTMRYAHATEADLRAAFGAMSPISPEAESDEIAKTAENKS